MQTTQVEPNTNNILALPTQENNLQKPLKIRDIVAIAFITLATAFATLGLIGGIVSAFIPPLGITLMTIAALALVTLGSLVLLEKILPYCPKVIRHVAYTIQMIVTEILAVIAQMAVSFVDLTKKNPKEKDIDPNQTPILMIHGFLGSSNNWIYHKPRLNAAGFKNVFTINLGSARDSIDTYAERVKDMVEEIKKATGRDDIRFVCHSMGGLVARQYLYNYSKNTNVRDIITIGSPLKGTYVAYSTLGLSKCGKEMRPGSPLIKKQLEEAALDTKTGYYHIGSDVDCVIVPNISAHGGGSPACKTHLLENAGHVAQLFSDETADQVIDYLTSHPQS